MQRVSNEYKKSMKAPLRERAYIKLSFGLINQMAQAKASINKGEYTYYSSLDVFREYEGDKVYATLEENFTKADGSMCFLPPPDRQNFYDTGLISKELVSNGDRNVVINLNTHPTDIKGFTLLFGDNYPIDFDIIGNTGQKIEVRGNDKKEWFTEEVIKNVTGITIVFKKMKNHHSRARIYSVKFGYGLVYDNESVITSSLHSYVSPIGADLPQTDFSVQLKNYDRYFNVDNPGSAINYLETGQIMNVMYGYQLPDSDKIEWLQGMTLACSGWESDDNTATIKCQDILRNMESEYFKGVYRQGGKDFYSLIKDVLSDAGITGYYIDPMLKKLYTKNPLPKVKHKEALQIIANACRCNLSISRTGEIQVKSNFMPKITVSTNGETHYSKSANILNDTVKPEYASFAKNYTKANGSMFFLPKTGTAGLPTGYISNEISDEKGKFKNNPVVTFMMDNTKIYYGIRLEFGQGLPKQFIIKSFVEGRKVNEYEINADEISKSMVVVRDFDDCDKMQIEFTETAIPHNRITLNYFSLSDVTNFTMERHDILSPLKAIKQELVKDIIVPCYEYQRNSTEETLLSVDVTAVSGKTETFYTSSPADGYVVLLNDVTGRADIIEWGNYYVTVRYRNSGSFVLKLKGHRYKVTERYAVKKINEEGKTIKWKNPLVSDMAMAEKLAEWLGEYYSAGIEYEYDTRGNPELDVSDIIYQENDFVENMKVAVYRQTLEFSQALSGKITARKTGG